MSVKYVIRYVIYEKKILNYQINDKTKYIKKQKKKVKRQILNNFNIYNIVSILKSIQWTQKKINKMKYTAMNWNIFDNFTQKW